MLQAGDLTAFKRVAPVGIAGESQPPNDHGGRDLENDHGAPTNGAMSANPATSMKSQQQPEATCLLAALAAFQADLARILDLLAARPTIAADASAAHGARTNAKLRGFFWTHEFAAVIGHSRQYVSDRCAARVIKTLKGGAPHRIPLSEEIVWNGGVS